MIQCNAMIFIAVIILTILVFLVIGYIMGRKTRTDVPLFERKFNPDDGKEPEQDEIMACLHGDQK